MSYLINLSKERFKFSASHFTIFSSTDAECLHGHNYQVSCEFSIGKVDDKLGYSFLFSEAKDQMTAICENLDEKVLIPQKSPYLEIAEAAQNIEVRFAKKFYSFPKEDVLVLPLVNLTSEELAKYLCEKLIENISFSYQSLKVWVEESPGQRVAYLKSF